MIVPILTAMHNSAMCMGATALATAGVSHFTAGRYAGGIVKVAATLVTHRCPTCAGRMPMPKKQHNESVHTLRYGERFQIDACEIAPDKLEYLRGSHGYRYILTIIDCASKQGAMYPLKTLTMTECVEVLTRHFKRTMVPDILHSDNGRQFRNRLVGALAGAAGFTQVHGSAETPQHQGQIERFNRTAKALLFVWITENWQIADEQWHSIGLEECEAKYMRSEHRTLGMAPDMYMLGRMKTPALRAKHELRTATM